MIRATTPYEAVYRLPAKNGAKETLSFLQVIAWSDEGDAMVVDGGNGRLVPANRSDTFERVQRATGQYFAAIPGAGWQATTVIGDDGDTVTEPVVCWLVDPDGDLVAVTVDASGDFDVLTAERRRDDTVHFTHPGGGS